MRKVEIKLRKVGNLLSDGGNLLSIAGGSLRTTVAQKGDQRLEIRKCDQLTDGLTWEGARDTCVSKNEGEKLSAEHFELK